MGELGQLLRDIREEKNISLEEVENATRIRKKYLVALEEGDYDTLPTPGHVRGFLRNYALYIGLDLKQVEEMYTKETTSRHIFEPGIFHPKDIDLSPRKSFLKADLVLGLVVILVILVVGGWAFWQYAWPIVGPRIRSAATPTASPTAEQAAVVPSSTATSTRVVAATRTPTQTPVPAAATSTPTAPAPTATATLDTPLVIATPTLPPTETPTPAPTIVQSVVLQIKVIERAWLQVTLDGQEQPGELLEAGAEREWVAQNELYFICGNAGGVEVTVNGEELGLLGERAQVVEKIWTPLGEATPTPVPEEMATAPAETQTPAPTATATP